MQQLTKLPCADWLVLIVVRPYKQTPLKHFDNFTRKIIRTGNANKQVKSTCEATFEERTQVFGVNFKLILLFRKIENLSND